MHGMSSESVYNSIREIRQEKGITQEELASAVGVSRQTIISIEKGNYVPSVLLALKIAKHFDTSVETLFTIQY
jgi:putative transcriptional regulator